MFFFPPHRAGEDFRGESEDSGRESAGGGGAGEGSADRAPGAQPESHSIQHLSINKYIINK